MAEEIKDDLLDHDYDGIQEYDNPLPGWWVMMFWLCIAASAIYVPYHHFGKGKLQIDEYEAEMKAAKLSAPPVKVSSDEALAALVKDPNTISAGKGLFAKHCVACHLADGGGSVGPNLTDEFWIHGGSMKDVVKVVTDGVPAKGMLAWKTQLKPKQILQVSAYVKSLKGTTPATPKAPQGTKYEGE